MTEKQTELHRIVLRLAESGELATLTKLMLDIESTIEKYKRLEEAGQELLKYLPNMEVLGAARYSAHLKTAMCFREVLKKLEQE